MANGADDLVAWLREQVDEDERVARAAMHRPRSHPPTIGHWGYVHEDLVDGDGLVLAPRVWIPAAEHIARHDPARVLREVAAKRRILDWHRHATFYREPIGPTCEVCGDHDGEDWCQTLRLLALPYADRDGYRSEWAPAKEVSRG